MAAAKTVLIVEDEALIAIDLEESVRDLGYDPLVVADLDAARAAAQSAALACAILDFQVGRADTSDVAQKLLDRQIPFLVCSGSDAGMVREQFSEAAFVPKPYTDEVLRGALRTVLPSMAAAE